MLETMLWLNDDRIPYLDMTTGTEIFAETFGCKFHRPIDDMPFVRDSLEIQTMDMTKSVASLLSATLKYSKLFIQL